MCRKSSAVPTTPHLPSPPPSSQPDVPPPRPGFTAINEPPIPPVSGPRVKVQHGLPPQPRVAKQELPFWAVQASRAVELSDRDFEVDQIKDWLTVDRNIYYLVEWTTCNIPVASIEEEDRRSVVYCDGLKYHVRVATPQLVDDKEEVALVVWDATWRALHTLPRAAATIQEFELQDSKEDLEFPAHLLPQHVFRNGHSYEIDRVYPFGELPPGTIGSLDFIPQSQHDYAPQITALAHREHSHRQNVALCLTHRTKRGVVFRDGYVARLQTAKRKAKMSREEKFDAALLVCKGDIQPRACANCVKLYGPFVVCVALSGVAKGVCANCVWVGKRMQCNWHVAPGPGVTPYRTITDIDDDDQELWDGDGSTDPDLEAPFESGREIPRMINAEQPKSHQQGSSRLTRQSFRTVDVAEGSDQLVSSCLDCLEHGACTHERRWAHTGASLEQDDAATPHNSGLPLSSLPIDDQPVESAEVTYAHDALTDQSTPQLMQQASDPSRAMSPSLLHSLDIALTQTHCSAAAEDAGPVSAPAESTSNQVMGAESQETGRFLHHAKSAIALGTTHTDNETMSRNSITQPRFQQGYTAGLHGHIVPLQDGVPLGSQTSGDVHAKGGNPAGRPLRSMSVSEINTKASEVQHCGAIKRAQPTPEEGKQTTASKKARLAPAESSHKSSSISLRVPAATSSSATLVPDHTNTSPESSTTSTPPQNSATHTLSSTVSEVCVYREKQFGRGEASVAQVRYILKRCDAIHRLRFEDRWKYFQLNVVPLQPSLSSLCKEEVLSQAFSEEMNEAVTVFCDPFYFQPPAKVVVIVED
ncbi:hypothetical protein LTR97_012097 [Elasticomyces elasticus]|uniref:Uncharacterized protein n=1 Tax=Elasticomyces elasticus TaxID=574655 RepID=A0AAN7VZ52_9PEZI|nr:hypothetical protein LTR97_012097 [Elasticomyces elasticus]